MSEKNGFLGSMSNSALHSLLRKSVSSKSRTSSATRPKSKFGSENKAPVDPNIQISDPPLFSSNPLPKKALSKLGTPPKELVRSEAREEVSEAPDRKTVMVMVRIRPGNALANDDRMIRGVSKDSLSVGDKKFTFDTVFNSSSTQEDVFQSVGIPLVKDALAGYNTSLLAYGQTGSGKTYTLFGPPSAMVESPSTNGLQGLVPRIFQMLFSNIQSEHESSGHKQISYQCRCSFLEIYNERIGDLLDPMLRDLKIRDDAKNGFYVENLTEEYVSTYEDVTQILIKGLSSRKVGSTGINSKSSRSHVVFTCIIESWCKENSSKCFGSSKTSRITLVDLAGFERNLLEDAGKQYASEGKFVKKSTSQLGRLVNILTDQKSTRAPEAVPYSCSGLTHLLRESLGGNAKLTVICTVSQEDKHMSDTISTLRFGKKVKLVKNEPIINEITEDDVNGLSDQIRLLKEELIRTRSSTNNAGGRNNGYFKGRSSTRESLNQLRVSLNRSLILPRFDNNDSKEGEEININEDDIKELQIQIDNIRNSLDEGSVMSEPFVSCSEESESEEEQEEQVRERETDLQDPVLSESPKFGNVQRKSIVVASSKPSLKNNEVDFLQNTPLGTSGLPQEPEKGSRNLQTSSLRSSRIIPGLTESLAASLQRGLHIIDHHQQNSSESMRPSFSFDHFAVKSTAVQESSSQEEVQDSCLKTWIVPFSQKNNGDKQQEFEKDLKEALEREKKLESVCEEQAEKIQKLSQLLSQCKCETQKSDLVEAMGDKNMTQPINSQEKFLEWNGKGEDSHEQEIVKEIQGVVVDHSDGGGGGTQRFEAAERDALIKEIENLRTKLQETHTRDAISVNKSIERLRQSRGIKKKNNGETEEELESERQRWTEMESDWISLTDELRIDIETIRQRAEKAETELKLEKKCTAELDDALGRSVVGHARMVEHYVDLQEKHNELVEKHRLIMAGIQDIKMAAAKAGTGRKGNRFAKSLAAELSSLRVERERERELLRKENRSLKAQLRDTAEAVHAAGELLVRLREAEETACVAEEKLTKAEEENESLKKQIEKQKRKHKMEMATMKGYLAQSRLPEAALMGKHESESESIMMDHNDTKLHSSYDHHDADDDQAWRAEFGAIYQQDY